MKTFLVSLVLLAASAATLSAQTPAQNKAKVMAFYQAFNGDIAKFNAASFVAADFVDYAVPPEGWAQMGADGVARFQAAIQAYKTAFPDAQFKPTITVTEGEYVMVYGESTGTFRNDFMGIKATGKSFKFMDVDIIKFNAAGLAVGHWSVQDAAVMWTQLGVDMK